MNEVKPMRESWDDYWFRIAKDVASRSTCPRLSVGCVIVRDNRTVATGYNGSGAGEPHCITVGCDMVDGHCKRVRHSEANAVTYAARSGTALDGCTAYITHSPCLSCERLLRDAGIVSIKYGEVYISPVDQQQCGNRSPNGHLRCVMPIAHSGHHYDSLDETIIRGRWS